MGSPRRRLPKLPSLIEQKLTKTGYTRGATAKEIYQNRVRRNNPVLIPWAWWDRCKTPDDGSSGYQNGFLVLLEPSWYFENAAADRDLAGESLVLGENALLLFRRREDWNAYRPASGYLANGRPFGVAVSRVAPLGGVYFARIHGTVAQDGGQIVEGFNTTSLRGAGIRVYEYASTETIERAKLQLEALVWLCHDSVEALCGAGMSLQDAVLRRDVQLESAADAGLLDEDRLKALRILGSESYTVCPLCREPISAGDMLRRSSQAEGRETYDITTTEISLFHIQELRVGKFQHKPYNLGWGHHFCNVVVKDAGIAPTLEWMQRVLDNQGGDVRDLAQAVRSVKAAAD